MTYNTENRVYSGGFVGLSVMQKIMDSSFSLADHQMTTKALKNQNNCDNNAIYTPRSPPHTTICSASHN